MRHTALELSPAELGTYLRYDPETGELWWLPRAGNPAFNTTWAGRQALTALDSEGYRHGMIRQKDYRAHRVAWAIQTGSWPVHKIDHDNGDRTDNRWSNLRDKTSLENSRNSKLRCTNSSGVSDVRFDSRMGMWQARIRHDGKRSHLGYFTSLDDAARARKSAERRYGYHPNHGRTAP